MTPTEAIQKARTRLSVHPPELVEHLTLLLDVTEECAFHAGCGADRTGGLDKALQAFADYMGKET